VSILVSDPDLTIHEGDALDVLRGLPDGSVDCCVTSPPYWGLRDYGTGSWDGGNADCDHLRPPNAKDATSTLGTPGHMPGANTHQNHAREPWPNGQCGKCGARRVDQQLGLEATPDEYVANMVAVFREVRRVLADHGTLWLNIGDSYAGGGPDRGGMTNIGRSGQARDRPGHERVKALPGLKQKDLCGVPWRVAFALQADGWYLRSDIIWAKPNPMPESVTDRPTKAHEYVFLLSKRPRYWFDAEAVREKAVEGTDLGLLRGRSKDETGKVAWAAPSIAKRQAEGVDSRNGNPSGGRNVRSVWEIATQPYPDAHFATFPEELPRRCVLAGCPEWVCGTCHEPRVRITDVSYEKSPVHGAGSVVGRHYETGANGYDGAGMPRLSKRTETVGCSDCGHGDYRPGVVLDPFLGSGTTALVARNHGRSCVGIELNPVYAALAARRLQQLSLLAVPA
jgi:DNA modification methylase